MASASCLIAHQRIGLAPTIGGLALRQGFRFSRYLGLAFTNKGVAGFIDIAGVHFSGRRCCGEALLADTVS